jgi:hypothetical protein
MYKTIGINVSLVHSPRWCATLRSESSYPSRQSVLHAQNHMIQYLHQFVTAVKWLDIPESCFSTLVSRETLSLGLIDFVLEGRENIAVWQKLTWFICSYCGNHKIKTILILLCFLGEWSNALHGEDLSTYCPPGLNYQTAT